MKNTFLIILAFLAMVTLPGCASISLIHSWKDPGVSAKQYRKLLVVGISDKTEMRQVFEEVFAGEINNKGLKGIPSYTITGVEPRPTRAALEEAVKKSGADGVITTRVVAMKKDTDVRTGFIMTDRGYTNPAFAGSDVYPNDLFDFYGASVSYATFKHQSVEVTMSTRATIETNLFDAVTGRLVWSGTSSAVNPEGLIKNSQELADLEIKALAREGLI